jgi:hypothetical protein
MQRGRRHLYTLFSGYLAEKRSRGYVDRDVFLFPNAEVDARLVVLETWYVAVQNFV